jgi:hypothetical protein
MIVLSLSKCTKNLEEKELCSTIDIMIKDIEKGNSSSLHSSVEEKGDIVTIILQFSHGNKKTFPGVITKTITQSEFTRFDLTDGRKVYIHTKNVDWFEII